MHRCGPWRRPWSHCRPKPDELGRLAQAIDGYQARLVEADASERAFFADASHELRTPVAVVRGAAEVLSEQDDLDEATRQRIRRIDRGVGELGELVDVLLRLVRREPVEMIEVDIARLLHDGADCWCRSRREDRSSCRCGRRR